jgi:hypothetical protein
MGPLSFSQSYPGYFWDVDAERERRLADSLTWRERHRLELQARYDCYRPLSQALKTVRKRLNKAGACSLYGSVYPSRAPGDHLPSAAAYHAGQARSAEEVIEDDQYYYRTRIQADYIRDILERVLPTQRQDPLKPLSSFSFRAREIKPPLSSTPATAALTLGNTLCAAPFLMNTLFQGMGQSQPSCHRPSDALPVCCRDSELQTPSLGRPEGSIYYSIALRGLTREERKRTICLISCMLTNLDNYFGFL